MVEAYRIHWSMVFISRNFQLSPLAAERYSRLLMPLDFFGCCFVKTESPCFMQISSEIPRRFFKVLGPWRSIRPDSQQTALTRK